MLRQWHRNVINKQWKKICFCWEIYKNLKEQNFDFNIKNVYIDKLVVILNEYNNTYGRTTEMKSIDDKYNTYIYPSKEVFDKIPKF